MAREPDDIVEIRRALGRQLASFRKAAGLSQADLGRSTAYHRSTVAHIESGTGRADETRFWDTVDKLTHAAGTLVAEFAHLCAAKHAHDMQARAAELADARASADAYRERNLSTLLDVALATHTPATPRTTTVAAEATSAEGEDVKRAEFIAGLAAAVAAPGIMFGQTTRIGAEDVRRYRQNLEHLYALDDSYGASADVYSLTLHTLGRLRRDFNHASYAPAVGQEIRSIAGQLMEHAGWLAFDAGQATHARHWWLEALHAARMADSGDDVEIVVLASMSASASRQGRGREAVDLATTAQRVAKAHATPRLVSLLSAREALGHARAGDSTATTRVLERARTALDAGRSDDDPLWLDFWDAADLAGHESMAARYLHDLERAETSARAALGMVDGRAYPRNQAMNLARLAYVLAAEGNLDEAVPLTAKAALDAYDLHSHRITAELTGALRALAQHRDHAPARQLVEHVAPTVSAAGKPWPTL